jgi:hypothetical protein
MSAPSSANVVAPKDDLRKSKKLTNEKLQLHSDSSACI